MPLSPACVIRERSTVASDTSGAEDVAVTESDVESLGTSLVSSSGQSVATSATNGGSGGVMPLDNTTTPNSDVGSWFQPAGCVQTTIDVTGNKATYVFNACTGPLGLALLDGTVDVTWSDEPGQLTLDYEAHGFKINRSTIDAWQASAVITGSAGARHMTWHGQLSGTTGRGRSFTRTNDKSIDWTVGQPCITVSGQSDGTIVGVELKTTIDSFQPLRGRGARRAGARSPSRTCRTGTPSTSSTAAVRTRSSRSTGTRRTSPWLAEAEGARPASAPRGAGLGGGGVEWAAGAAEPRLFRVFEPPARAPHGPPRCASIRPPCECPSRRRR